MTLDQKEINKYLQPLEIAFSKAADPLDAVPMKGYMKNKFEFYGIKSAPRKSISSEFLNTYHLPDISYLPDIVKACYRQEEREFQYFAIDLVIKLINKLDKSFLRLSEWMIINKSWWDTVDAIAVNITGPLLFKYPELAGKMDNYILSDNLWLRRTAIIYQLKYKQQTDFDRLKRYSLTLADDNNFFIKKAIGWALREYSKICPDKVILFTKNSAISAFSKKEALKWLKRKAHG